MTLTNSYLRKLKGIISPVRIKNEWDIFVVYARQRHAGTLCRVASALDNIAFGKRNAEQAHLDFVSLCVGATVALERTPKLAELFLREIETRVEADSKLTKIKRDFPDFVRTPASIPSILMEYKGLSGTFLAVLAISNWLDSEDLVQDIVGIAKLTDLLRIANEAKRVYRKVKAKTTLVEDDRRGLQFLRNIAERHVLVATMQGIPHLPDKLEKSNKALSVLIADIVRFPVTEELEQLIKQATDTSTLLQTDVTDFFGDYPNGVVRKKGLKNFPELCRKYALLPLKE